MTIDCYRIAIAFSLIWMLGFTPRARAQTELPSTPPDSAPQPAPSAGAPAAPPAEEEGALPTTEAGSAVPAGEPAAPSAANPGGVEAADHQASPSERPAPVEGAAGREAQAEAAAEPAPGADEDDPDEDQGVVTTAGDPWGDEAGFGSRLLSFRALLQLRYTSTFAERSTASRASYAVREEHLAQEGDGWSVRRAFFRIASNPSDYIGLKMVLDLAELIDKDPEDAVTRAYVRLRPIPKHVELFVGLFKKPFSTLEIDPSRKREVAERGESNALIKDLGYAGRDLGAQIVLAPFSKAKRLRLYVGAYRGHAKDEFDSPAGMYSARIETKPGGGFRFGAGVSDHFRAYTYDRPFNTSDKDALPDPPDPLYPNQKRWGRGRAYGIDARFKKKGFMLRGEGLYGDRVDIDERYGAETFWAAWGLMAYKFRLGPIKLKPAVRAEWFDSDLQHKHGRRRLLTVGLTAMFLEHARFLVDVSHLAVQPESPVLNQPKPLQQDPYMDLDRLLVTTQLQVDL